MQDDGSIQGKLPLRAGPFVLDHSRLRLVSTDDGAVVALRPKSVAVLQYLAEHTGSAVSRDELMQAVWPNVFVSDDSITQCIGEIRQAMGRHASTLLRTIPARGYVLEPWTPKPAGVKPGDCAGRERPISATSIPAMSIVVLPFENLAPWQAGAWFSDGLTAEVTADLSNIEGMFVISRGSAMRFRRRRDTRATTDALRVRYALEGCVRRTGRAIQVTVQLVEGASGLCLWSERLETGLADLAAAQDEITGRIAQTLRCELVHTEARRVELEGRSDVSSMDLALRGWSALYAVPTHATLASARRLFGAAVERDPHNADALVGLASAHAYAGICQLTPDSDAALRTALALSSAALEANPRSARARLAQGHALRGLRRTDEAAEAYGCGVQRDRNLASAWSGLGTSRMQLGHPGDEVAMHRRATELSPRDPFMANWAFSTGRSLHLMGQDEEGLQWFRAVRRLNPQFLPLIAEVHIAALSLALGDNRSSIQAFGKALQMDPNAVESTREWVLSRSGQRAYRELVVRTLAALDGLEMRAAARTI